MFEFYNSKGLFSHQNIKAMTTVWTREDTNVFTTQFASLFKSAHLCGLILNLNGEVAEQHLKKQINLEICLKG